MIHDMTTRYYRLKREMAYSKQAIGKLMSMLRACQHLANTLPTPCLEYAKSMLRVWQEYASKQTDYSHTGNKTFFDERSGKAERPYWEQNIPTLGIKTGLRLVVTLLLMIVGVNAWGQTPITSLSDITDSEGSYILASTFSTTGTPANGIGTSSDNPFKGTIDGQLVTITGTWDKPLFDYVEDATIKNVIISSVSVSTSGNAGAIAANAKGETRIYNCGILGGTVSGSAYTGGLVGQLYDKGEDNKGSHVINCYSYANITGGSDVGGIVGYNNYASKADNIRTMVMNCMFYGDITGGNNVSPVYGGQNIDNVQGGLNNFNYYAYDELKTKAITKNKYNCALAVEKKYLNRFEIYRQLLNSNKKLAAYYASTATTTVSPSDMAKWVLETADRSINNPKPYPILKVQGKYPSIINIDSENAPSSASERNKGGITGTLSVKIQNSTSGGQTAPTGANISTTITLNRTDKDFDRFNYNYDKVQLPYYNDYGTGNYTENKVVTGWKIVDITTITGDPYTNSNYDYTKTYADNPEYFDYPNYNFADRKSSQKDLYSVSGRIFSQGAYFDVPYGVTSITIEPYWGKAAYVSDEYLDVVYNSGYSVQSVTQLGRVYGSNGTNVSINNNTQKVYTSIKNALNSMSGVTNPTVYDYAVVLVGNLHQSSVPSDGDKPFTMMSVDLDNDHEPDYSMIYHHNSRATLCPLRFDFLNIPGTAQAQKPNGASLILNAAIFRTKGWFEITNTAFIYFTQFEYENTGVSTSPNTITKTQAPLILLGGYIDQFVSAQSAPLKGKTIYIHVGGNVLINSFGLGTHSDGSGVTQHVPVSVTGGDYNSFYLSGTYNQDAVPCDDNAECYISGGRFGELAGAAQEQIGSNNSASKGNIHWQIYDADITDFYGGGVNDAKPVQGNITTDIFNSHVTTFCGGPKFGNMAAGKKVTSNAEGCTFDKFFGAGFGGNSYSRKKYFDNNSGVNWTNFQNWYITDKGKYFDGATTNSRDSGSGNDQYGKKGVGVATDFDYDLFVWTSGKTGGRFYVKFVSFSLAQCNDVESKLTGCTIKENFYGGGSLGRVTGKATSELDGCTVNGNVFGGGYSAVLPTIEVRDAGFTKFPNINSSSGMFEPAELSGTTTFTWKSAAEAGVTLSNNASGSDLTNHYVYTNQDLTILGQVGETDLTIKGNTQVTGSVFGGGDESAISAEGGATGNTKVTIEKDEDGATPTISNVFGGGNTADVGGNAVVEMSDGKVSQTIYGGCNSRGTLKGNTSIEITGGTVGTEHSGDAAPNDAVFGGGKGEPTLVNGNVTVNIGREKTGTENVGTAIIHGLVYGGSALGNTNAQWVTDNSTSPATTTLQPVAGKKTVVNLYKGTINGDVYGGGLGRKAKAAVGNDPNDPSYVPAVAGIEATVGGDVTVTLDGVKMVNVFAGVANSTHETGRIFGCNNLNGSPKGHVKVHVKQTVPVKTPVEDTDRDVVAVYGGGNEADYNPTADDNTEVIIEGCGVTTIHEVYGGGNAAAVPATEVWMLGCKQIDNLFGGGNGEKGPDHAAHVGFHREDDLSTTDYTNGTGKALVKLIGGTITNVYGGSNSNGDIRGGADISMPSLQTYIVSHSGENPSTCTLKTTNIYGGGKNADMSGGTKIVLGCMPNEWIEDIYAGAQNADVTGDVSLTITSGMFKRVFGGNKDGGLLKGSITVNVEETGSCDVPIVIGELYGGGNLAAYSIYGYNSDKTPKTKETFDSENEGKPDAEKAKPYDNPQLNVRAFTSIGKIFGGGYKAKMIANPTVDINVAKGSLANDATIHSTTVGEDKYFPAGNGTTEPSFPAHKKGEIGAIGSVFGGGNLAEIVGNATVNIGSETKSYFITEPTQFRDPSAPDTPLTPVADGDYKGLYEVTVEGANITGSVYGGGQDAVVTGNTQVNICAKKGTGDTYNKVTANSATVKIAKDVFGAGKGLTTEVNNATVIMGGGAVGESVYGGGELGSVIYDTQISIMDGAIGDPSVEKGGATIGNVYGGGMGQCDTEKLSAGLIKGNTTVNISGGTVYHNIYGGGAYGSVGTYTYDETTHENTRVGDTGTANITITGGTIGINGKENGMVFGSSRGDVAKPDYTPTGSSTAIDKNNLLAWVYDTNVTIGTPNDETPGPAIKGSVYGSGENGHTLHNTKVIINSGTIGINSDEVVTYKDDSTDPTKVTFNDKAYNYPYRGNIYGGGCGTDMYDSDNDDVKDAYNPMAGIVQGTSKVEINGGTIVRNVYGGGAMGSVDVLSSVEIKSGIVGVDGSDGGYVYAAARGDEALDDSHQAYVGASALTVTDGIIQGDAFGGGQNGIVKGAVTVNLTGGTVKQDVYGGGQLAKTNTEYDANDNTKKTYTTTVNLGDASGGTTITGNLYGGGLGRQHKDAVLGTDAQGTEGEPGYVPATPGTPEVIAVEADVNGPVTVTVANGKAANVFGCNNLFGAPQSTVEVDITGTVTSRAAYDIDGVYGGGNQAAYTGSPVVKVSGGLVNNVFGGGLGATAVVTGNPSVTISGGHVVHNVYGGGSEAVVTGSTSVTISGGSIENDVYGGGNEADVTGSVAVKVTGGKVTNDVYGGGALANTNTANWNTSGSAVEYVPVTGLTPPTFNEKAVAAGVNVKGLYTRTGTSEPYEYHLIDNDYTTTEAGTYYERVSGSPIAGYFTRTGSEGAYVYNRVTTGNYDGNVTYYKKQVVGTWVTTPDNGQYYNTSVELTGGLIGNVYGGALGNTTTSANVYGDVTVTVNDPTKMTTTSPGVAFTQQTETATVGGVDYPTPVKGRVFGCNNVNGTPTGNVTVHVYSTRQLDADENILPGHGSPDRKYPYEIQAVYGGGNKADYLPTAEKGTHVFIEGCDETSIENVYGGGNSSVVPETDVLIKSAYDISHAFGGGNGGQPVKKDGVWYANDGAVVINTAKIVCQGGKIGYVYGAGDAKGSCGNTSVDTNGGNPNCPLVITHLYGAGNEGDVTGDVNIVLAACSGSPIKYVHGGSYNAHISGKVTLTITSGLLENVYGGNDARGGIYGDIVVNIEETDGCNPIIIENLVGGGNMAPYPGTHMVAGEEVSYTHKGNITVDVKSATHIGNIYGGCFQAEANADTKVNINMVKGCMVNTPVPAGYTIPNKHTGSAWARYDVAVGTSTSGLGLHERSGYVGSYTYTPTTDETVQSNKTYYKYIETTLIDDAIGTIGNVYGGGNLGLVKGDAVVNIATSKDVKIMKRNASGQILDTSDNVISTENNANITATIAYVDKPSLGANITGDVFGGGNQAAVTGSTEVNIYTDKTQTLDDDKTYPAVDFSSNTGFEGVSIGESVYGGGSSADVRGNTIVRMAGGYVFDGVYGGGLMGSVGTLDETATNKGRAALPTGHTHKEGETCVGGKPEVFLANTGKCTVVISGGQIGPTEVAGHYDATEGVLTNGGMKNKGRYFKETSDPDGPVDVGFVFGAGRGDVMSYAENADADFLTYVYETDVTIKGTALIMGSVYGGGENGRVRGDTHVKIKGGQIGCGEGMVDSNNKPIRYTDGTNSTPNQFIDPTDPDITVTSGEGGNALAECSSWDYGEDSDDDDDEIDQYNCLPHDPLAYLKYSDGTEVTDGSTTATDGHTYYGNVFGGGSGYYPYVIKDIDGNATGHSWLRSAGWVEGNTVVDITGGHILTSVYGGNEMTDVGHEGDANTGKCTVNMSGGTLGVPRTLDQIAKHPVTCYLFGAGKGDQRTHFNTWTNINEAEVNVTGGIIYGSVFGGGEDGHVLGNVTVNIKPGAKIGTWGTSYVDGNVFGGGRGFSGVALTAGNVGGNVDVNISGGTMLGSIYGGGRLASVGTYFTDPNNEFYGQLKEDDSNGTYGHISVNISGGTIGNDREFIPVPYSINTEALLTSWKTTNNIPNTEFYYGKDDKDNDVYLLNHNKGGNVFGGNMGRLTLQDGSYNSQWAKLAVAKTATVNISGNATIKGSVYGGGEFGTVRENTYVTVGGTRAANGEITKNGSPIINRDVYGGGYGSEEYSDESISTIIVAGYEHTSYSFTPMQFAGSIGGDTHVNICGGQVKKSVYGGGELATVGVIDYKNAVKHGVDDPNSQIYDFGLSWPYKFTFVPYVGNKIGGTTHVSITGGRIGITGKDYTGPDAIEGVTLTDDQKKARREDNGDVYGGGKGKVGPRYDYAFCANVKATDVTIDIKQASKEANPDNYKVNKALPCITGSVYGGGENGHVNENTKVIMTNGLVGHAIYGGGKGKDTYKKAGLKRIEGGAEYEADIYSVTAGKVYGNTYVEMAGGYVVRNIYGGGNMASVGKGNYSGGDDDYSKGGYGETLSGNLWDNGDEFSQAFLSSGKTYVNIKGGQVGCIIKGNPNEDGIKDGLPYGNVFGGARGASAPNIEESPRYLYAPLFYAGYVNETHVHLYDSAGVAPKIFGSVYGGGQDGHVRRDTHVIIDAGEIGKPYTSATAAEALVATSDVSHAQWLHRGNVYGSGSGIGEYKYDFNGDNDFDDEIEEYGTRKITLKEKDYSNSAGSVTRFSTVEINGGTIHRNVYGGGSLATVGPPKIGQPDYALRRDDNDTETQGKQSLSKVVIKGGTIGDESSYDAATGLHVYGGDVYAASRGMEMNSASQSSFSTGIWTELNILGGQIYSNVYGGGELGEVKKNTIVYLLSGVVDHDAYGGGRGTEAVAANVGGDVTVYLNGVEKADYKAEFSTFVSPISTSETSDYRVPQTKKGAVVENIFGCNDLNGTPKGHTKVHVFATQHKNKKAIQDASKNDPDYVKYDKFAKLSDDKDKSGNYKGIGYNITNYKTSFTDDKNKTYVALTDPANLSTGLASTVGMTASEISPYTNIIEADATFFTDAKIEELREALGLTFKEGDDKVQKIKEKELENFIDAIADKKYDVKHVYGGGDLAEYHPTYADTDEDNEVKQDRTKVIIDGCDLTSIKQVYGAGNAAASSGTYVRVNGTYEIHEVFGGGNGKDPYRLDSDKKWYENTGANVGYHNYMEYVIKENPTDAEKETYGEGTRENPYKPQEKADATNKALRQLHYRYGSGIAETEVVGGRIHNVYGGSNQKGNISTMAMSAYQESGTCELIYDIAYNAGKNAEIDGEARITLDCVKEGGMVYGGATNADLNSGVTLNITNGTFTKVFGGNNQGGRLNGPITVEVKENGCKPIFIDELYGAGNEADYSVYGYYQDGVNAQNKPIYKPRNKTKFEADKKAVLDAVTYPDEATDEEKAELDDEALIAANLYGLPYRDPHINIISASGIGTIYGGGYKAKVVGSPHINVNMENGKILAKYMNDTDFPVGTEKTDANGHKYKIEELGEEVTLEGGGTKNVGILRIGTIGTVYGGGNEADILGNTNVEIGTGMHHLDSGQEVAIESGRNAATITGNVYGGGKMGHVGDFSVADATYHTSHSDVPVGKPYACLEGTGTCNVTISNGTIGPPNMAMFHLDDATGNIKDNDQPDNSGHVFGGGMGTNKTEDFDKAFVNYANVTINGTAFVRGSVFGGGENGRVLNDTHVIIDDDCQIGNGHVILTNASGIIQKDQDGKYILRGLNRPYSDDEWAAGHLIVGSGDFPGLLDAQKTAISTQYAHSLPECDSWLYGKTISAGQVVASEHHAPHDIFANETGDLDKYSDNTSTEGGRYIASDGRAFNGSVYGGGSGYFPYQPGKWLDTAGQVEGNTKVEVKGGHILTSLYGGCEMTSVLGNTEVIMTGGTLGVPRTLDEIAAHPVTCYVFGGGKGEGRSLLDETTNVNNANVTISGGWVYGSVFGGAEDGHVLGNATVTIEGNPVDPSMAYADAYAAAFAGTATKIGTWGTSYVDGNIFGGGRGFDGHNIAAGAVSGNATVDISGGTMLGSIYGGGRLGSVGIETTGTNKGEMKTDVADNESTTDVDESKTYGHITVNISGGTIGNDYENVIPNTADNTAAGITAAKAVADWDATDWANWKKYKKIPNTEFAYDEDLKLYRLQHTKGGNVFAGGMGRRTNLNGNVIDEATTGIDWKKLGNAKSTNLTISGGTIKGDVYGGGEFGAVRANTSESSTEGGTTTIDIQGGIIGREIQETVTTGEAPNTTTTQVTRYTYGSVFGGGYGTEDERNDVVATGSGETTIYANTKVDKFGALVSNNTTVNMTAGHVWANVYGGGKLAAVGGNTNVTISGGEIGKNEVYGETEPYYDDGKPNPGYVKFGGATMGNVFGGGMGKNTHTLLGVVKGNTNVTVEDTFADATYAAAHEGVDEGDVVSSPKIYHNVYGGGSLGSVGTFIFSDGVTNTGKYSYMETVPKGIPLDWTANTGVATVNIKGGTIGISGRDNGMVDGSSRGDIAKPEETILAVVPGGKALKDPYDKMAWVEKSVVTIGEAGKAGPHIKGSVYGGGENGHVFTHAQVNVKSGTIGIVDETDPWYDFGNDEINEAAWTTRGNVYGAGCGTDTYTDAGKEYHNAWAGCVIGNTEINISGGLIAQNVYGGGSMGSVGRILEGNNIVKHENPDDGFALSWPVEFKYQNLSNNQTTGTATINITGGRIGTTGSDNGDVYGGTRGEAGDRYEMAQFANVRETVVKVNYPKTPTEKELDKILVIEDNIEEGKVKQSLRIKLEDENGNLIPAIAGSVYGGSENGHVNENTSVSITEGLIGHAIYGGGKGKGTYTKTLKKIGSDDTYEAQIYGLTAGKVFGNTSVTMSGGRVNRNIYGGGNMGSIGKGNYAGGADDYYSAGYGETLTGNLWTTSATAANPDNAWHFLNSGKATVNITGGTVGFMINDDTEYKYFTDDTHTTTGTTTFGKVEDKSLRKKLYKVCSKDDMPTGNVFGGARGESAPNILESPRYEYCPAFFSGYVNQTDVTIGDESKIDDETYTGPTLYGSVYGGGQDGHVRRDTKVTVNKAVIGIPFAQTYIDIFGGLKNEEDKDNLHWLHRGNVYGSGSGIGKYEYDFDHDGDNYQYTIEDGKKTYLKDPVTGEKIPQTFTYRGSTMKEVDYSTSAGSVTRFTEININGGTIHRNVYGGGSLASVGPPAIPPSRKEFAYKRGTATRDAAFGGGPAGEGWWSQSLVTIAGATIGTPDGFVIRPADMEGGVETPAVTADYNSAYGGEVYGGSRGMIEYDEDNKNKFADFATTVWTQVNIKDGTKGTTIMGNVFGGGDAGAVKKDTDVRIGDE